MGDNTNRRLWWIVAAIAAVGFALRLAAAQGGLWLDEAWSAVMADQAATPLGVFLQINHDNNHHLNTLWLQIVGLDAPPWLQRGLSIASGTATIVVAATIGARRSANAAIVAAILFALSPILVTYGSEARGYAPMLLALLIGIDRVDRWLADPETPAPRTALALVALLGMLAQLTMMFGLAALGLWASWRMVRQLGWTLGIGRTVRTLLPATAVAVFTLVAILFAAHGRIAVGAVEAFTWQRWAQGLFQLFQYSFGDIAVFLIAIFLAGLTTGYPRREKLYSFAVIAGVAFPLQVAAAMLPNAGAARYYLLAGIALLLLLSLLIGSSLSGKRRLPALLALVLLVAAMLRLDWIIIRDQRADPAKAIAILAARAPAGADIATDHPRSEAILHVAAAQARYPLDLRQPCPAARFLFIERDGDAAFPATPAHCDAGYREIAGDHVDGLSGTHWKLYQRSDR